MSINQWYEEYRRSVEQSKEILDRVGKENRDLTSEEQESFDRAVADSQSLKQRIDAQLEQDERARQADEFADKIGYRSEPEPPAEKGVDADVRAFFAGERRSVEVRPEGAVPTDLRTLSKGSAGAGAATVPTSFYGQLIDHLIEVSGLMQAGPTVLNTSGGERIEVPKTTAHSTAALVAETVAPSVSEPVYAQATLDAYKYGFLMSASSELLADTGVDLLGYLAMQAGRALGNGFGAHAVNGDGSDKPQGIVPVATAGETGAAAVAGAFTADNIINLYYSVISPYRSSPSCAWLMRDATVAAIRKLKQDDQYIWSPASHPGEPESLLGKPLYTDPNVPAVAATNRSIVFGDISQHFVRLAGPIRFERSDDYAFNTDVVTWRAIMRADSELIDRTGAVKCFVGGAAS
jgi:HK97 family phage major capsid protein